MEYNLANSYNTVELDMYHCGIEDCKPSHSYGPAIRDHFLIHYIFSGKGIFQVRDRVYHLSKNQAFLICPNEITFYQADHVNPWTYAWVGFHGFKAEEYLKRAGLSQDNPIFTFSENNSLKPLFLEILQSQNQTRAKDIRSRGLLYIFLSELIDNTPKVHVSNSSEERRQSYVNKAISFIQTNYSRNITIALVAKHVGLDRSYLSSIFKASTGISPQDFLIQYRIDKACNLMTNQALSIGDISRSVGYNHPLTFSKIFKKVKGVSPLKYRKHLLGEEV